MATTEDFEFREFPPVRILRCSVCHLKQWTPFTQNEVELWKKHPTVCKQPKCTSFSSCSWKNGLYLLPDVHYFFNSTFII